jgi:hypothetical protein
MTAATGQTCRRYSPERRDWAIDGDEGGFADLVQDLAGRT